MRKILAIFKTPTIRTALFCAVFCAVALCSAQETARGIVTEKVGSVQNSAERPEPELRFQLGHYDCVNSVAWSPDSKYIASGSGDCTMKIWDATSGRELLTIKDSKSVNSVAWSPDGRYIAIGSGDCTVKIWNVSNWQKIHTLIGHSDLVCSVAWSPDSRYIASGSVDKTVKIWDAEREKELRTLTGHSELVHSVAWSPDGKYIASGGNDNMVKVWNADNGKEIRTMDKISGNVNSVAWSPDGKCIASGLGDVDVWDASSGNRIHVISTVDHYAYFVAWSPDSKYIATGEPTGQDIKVYDVSNGKEIYTMDLWIDSVYSISYSPNGKCIAIGTRFGKVVILEATSGKEISTTFEQNKSIYSISWSSDGKQIALTDSDGKVKMWNVSNGMEAHTSVFPDLYLYPGALSPNGRYITGKDDNTLMIYDATNGEKVYTFTEQSNIISSVSWSLDGKYIVSGGANGMIEVWDVTKGMKIHTIAGHSDKVECVEISPNGRYIASGSKDGTIKVWNASSGKEMYTITELTGSRIAWSPDSRYIINEYVEYYEVGIIYGYYCNSRVIVRDAISGKVVHILTGLSDVNSVTWSPDGRYIASGNYVGTIKVWDVFNWKDVHTLKLIGYLGSYRTIVWSPNGKHIASGSSDGTIKIWNAQNGALLSTTINGKDDEWLTYTPEGFFCGSEWATQNLVYIVDGMDVIGIDQVYDTYYRPDLVAAKMRGEDISEYASSVRLASLVRSGRAPMVSLSGIPAESSGRDMTFNISVRNTGGGIGAVNLLLNGKVIRLSDGVASADGETISFRHTVTLQNGSNTLEAFALNGAGLVESVRSSAQVVWRGATEKPDLYVLTAAVNRYRDKSLCLNYAVPDAQSVAEGFQKQKSGLYRNVHISQLNDSDVTKEKLATEFLRLSQHIRADDVFVFFISGHGMKYDGDGDYYYLPYDFRYTSEDSIPIGGISKNDLQKNLSKIKAGKTLVMLDTCGSGAFISDSNQRGISEKTAIDRLTRATGHATLAASADSQYAMEGYNGHGVFTYVFLEGIAGAADSNGDGYVTLNELSAFIEQEVPERSYEKWGYEQIPQKNLCKQDFPIAGK